MSAPSPSPELERADCPRCARLQAEIEALRVQLEVALAKISALEAELRRGKRQATPLGREAAKKGPKPPGRRRGKGLLRHREVPPEARHAPALHTPLPYRLGVPYGKISGLFASPFGLQVTPSALGQADQRLAERALRPAVITRKSGGCNKRESGARTHAILSRVLVTLRQQGRDAIEYLGSVLQAPGAPPPLLPRPGPVPL